MKKTIGTYFAHYFKMPHLHRDELQAIERAIQDTLRPKHYSLSCGGMEFERLADHSAEMEQANVLVISTHSPCMRLKFARSWAELYASHESGDSQDAIHQIAKIVSKGERPLFWAFCKFSAWLAPLVGFGSLAIAMGLINLEVLEMRSLYLVSWFLLMVSVWWTIGHRYMLHSFSCLDFRRPRPRESLFLHHRQKIAVFLAGLLLGSATVWLLARYLRLI